MPVMERNRLVGLVSTGDPVKMPGAEIEMEATATRTPRSLSCLSNTRESFTMRQLHEHKPSRHSFITGNVVRLSKRFPPRNAAPGPYKVVAQLPERDGQLQYRIKSGCEPFYRTVTENELESDVGRNPTAIALG
jgi:hypothetical protein